jgi:hypothetical protein
MLRQVSVSFSQSEMLYKHISGSEWFLEFNWKSTFNSKYLNCVTVYLQLTLHICTFAVNLPSLITVEFLLFIKSQFIINTENVLHLNHFTLGRVWLWMSYRFRGSFRLQLRLVWQAWKCVDEVYLYFQLQLSTLGCLSVGTDKNLKDLD